MPALKNGNGLHGSRIPDADKRIFSHLASGDKPSIGMQGQAKGRRAVEIEYFATLSPYYVVVVTKEKALLVLSMVVRHSDAGDEVNNVVRCRVEEIVAALVTAVAVDPFETKLRRWSRFIRHGCKFLSHDHVAMRPGGDEMEFARA